MQIKTTNLRAKQTRPCPECGAKIPLDSMDCPDCGALILDSAEDLDSAKEEASRPMPVFDDGSFFSQLEDEYPTWEQAMTAGQEAEIASQDTPGDFSHLFAGPPAETPMPAEDTLPGLMEDAERGPGGFAGVPADEDDLDAFVSAEDDLGAFEPESFWPQATQDATAAGKRRPGKQDMWHRVPQDAARRERMRASR